MKYCRKSTIDGLWDTGGKKKGDIYATENHDRVATTHRWNIPLFFFVPRTDHRELVGLFWTLGIVGDPDGLV